MIDLHLTPEAKNALENKKIAEFKNELAELQKKHGFMIISTLSYMEGALVPLTRVVKKDWEKDGEKVKS